jgi:hypothetical protein
MKPYSPQSNFIFLSSYQLENSARSWQKSVKRPSLKGFWESLISRFVFGSEPRIDRMRDRNGNLYFHVYDPTTRQSRVFDSEHELRVWLDKRYYL